MNFLGEIFRYRKYKINSPDYEEYWENRISKSNPNGLKFRDKIIAFLISQNSEVLDLGCGTGRLLNYLKKNKKIRGFGIDGSSRALNDARKKGVKTEKADISSSEFELDSKYDHIIISEFIEHISNPERLLEKVHNKFRKSLIITIPNIGHINYRIRLLLGRFPECWKWHPGEHVRFWTKKDFEVWLKREDNGFPPMKVKRFILVKGGPFFTKNIGFSFFV